ncbi:MAG: hypothetical protein ACYDH1_09590 [Anaerolineaceae bacterium]
MLKKVLFFVLSLTIMVGCQNTILDQSNSIRTDYPITEFTKNPTIIPTIVETIPVSTVIPTVEKPQTIVPTLKNFEITSTPMVAGTDVSTQNGTGYLLIDHSAVDKFELIPDEVVRQASAYRVLFRHASVGENLRYGLECLYGNYPNRRPNSCSNYYDIKYDFSNWSFQFRGNPGWIEKVDDFVRETEKQNKEFDVFMFTLGYLDGMDGTTFPEISNDENFLRLYIDKLEALETEFPDKTFVWWTMSLAQEGHQNTTKFNDMLRKYAEENNKILVDLADFETYTPDGTRCFDENQVPIICKNYTEEKVSGHLNELGRERAAKMFWYLMARLTGWKDS